MRSSATADWAPSPHCSSSSSLTRQLGQPVNYSSDSPGTSQFKAEGHSFSSQETLPAHTIVVEPVNSEWQHSSSDHQGTASMPGWHPIWRPYSKSTVENSIEGLTRLLLFQFHGIQSQRGLRWPAEPHKSLQNHCCNHCHTQKIEQRVATGMSPLERPPYSVRLLQLAQLGWRQARQAWRSQQPKWCG